MDYKWKLQLLAKRSKKARNYILKSSPPEQDWTIHKVTMYGKYDTYETALAVEKRRANESATESDIEEALLRKGKRKIIRNKFNRDTSVSPPPCLDDNNENDCIQDQISTSSNEGVASGIIIEHEPVIASQPENNLLFDMSNIPVILPEHVHTLTPTSQSSKETDIVNLLTDINIKLEMISNRLENIERNCNIPAMRRLTANSSNLPPLPLTSLEEIRNLEASLDDETIKNDFVTMLKYVGGTDKRNLLHRSLAKLFSNDLACICSWTGQKNNFQLKQLKLMKILNEIVFSLYPITTAEFEAIVMNWFRNGHQRFLREEKKKAIPRQ